MSETILTHTERIIMEILWEKGEMSNTEIFSLIGEQHDWSRHMVKLYTRGLADKGLLGINQISERKMRFYPLISKEAYLANAASGFIRNNYSGLSHMVVGLINNEKVSKQEILELEEMLKNFEEND